MLIKISCLCLDASNGIYRAQMNLSNPKKLLDNKGITFLTVSDGKIALLRKVPAGHNQIVEIVSLNQPEEPIKNDGVYFMLSTLS